MTTWPLLGTTCLSLLMATAAAAESTAPAPDREELVLASTNPFRSVPEAGTTAKRSRWARLNHEFLARLDPATGARMSMSLFDDRSFELVLTAAETRSPTDITWYGHLADVDGSTVILVIRNDVTIGNIWAPGVGTYHIRTGADGEQVIRELDPRAFPPCPCDDLDADADPGAGDPRGAGSDDGDDGDDGSIIDLLVVYTAATRLAEGGEDGIEALITLAEAVTNESYLNSDITTVVRVVGTAEVDYAESGLSFTDRARLFDPDDGYMDEVHELRDLLAADVVTLLVEELDNCGRAYFSITTGNVSHPELGFNVTRRSCAVDNLSFPHELGHNQGCRHDNDPSDGAFAYSHGYHDPGGVFRTIMAVYSATPRVPHMSHPGVFYEGLPTGTYDHAHNALTIDQTAENVARFRLSGFQDCNDNGIDDAEEIVGGLSSDCNDNGIPDECDGLPGPTIFVDASATGAGSGTSWTDAYRDLEDGLEAARGSGSCIGGPQIWVAAGTYRPGRGSGSRAATFALADGVGVYGGFAGTETTLDARDPEANPTILSGDLAGDDGPDFANIEENSFHVVTASDVGESAILDGFTVRSGNSAGETGFGRNGAALIVTSGNPTIRRCRFAANSADYWGGAVFLGASANATFEACDFIDNRAAYLGGAVASTATANTFTNCLFRDNSTTVGGAVGVSISGGSYINCLFSGNTALTGGAVFGQANCDPYFLNCTVVGNEANATGGIYIGSGAALVENSILWSNRHAGAPGEGAQVHAVDDGGVLVLYNCIEGLTGGLTGEGNIGDDPSFVDLPGADGVAGTPDDDLRLSGGSPCIDAAYADHLPPTLVVDLDGNPRLVDDPETTDGPSVLDMGVYEFQPSCPGDVDRSGAVDFADLLSIIGAWGPCSGCAQDIDDSGVVDFDDLLAVLGAWGPCR